MDSDGSNEQFIHSGSYIDFSPDGNYLVFSQYAESTNPFLTGGDALFIFDLKKRAVINQLTSPASSSAKQPDWSINNQIVFAEHVSFFSADYSNLCIYDINLMQNTELTDTLKYYWEPRWSPDGKTIAYHYEDKTPMIFIMLQDNKTKQLTRGELGGELDPVWSPDGNYIVFAGDYNRGPTNLYLMNSDGSGQRKILSNGSYIFPLDWIIESTAVHDFCLY
jgi:Tol biopolymer transport system component